MKPICSKCGSSIDSDRHRYCALNPAPHDQGYWRDEAQYRLAMFYAVHTKDALIEEQAKHIEKLQAKLPPLRDTQPGRVREG